jgi:hypothetical protein
MSASRKPTSTSQRQTECERLAWFAGLGLMTAFRMIDWPLALALAAGHEVTRRAHRRAVRELAEGIEAGL